MSEKLSKIIALCERPGMGIERVNAQFARTGRFDLAAKVGWLSNLAKSTDVERSAHRSEIRIAASEALLELAPRVIREAPKQPRLRYLVDEMRQLLAVSNFMDSLLKP